LGNLGPLNYALNKVEEIAHFHVDDITVIFMRKEESSEIIIA